MLACTHRRSYAEASQGHPPPLESETMKRSAVLRIGLGAALLALPAAAFFGYHGLMDANAQSAPPQPPGVWYGTATPSTVGQGVHSFISHEGQAQWCGHGAVVSHQGSPRYVVQVAEQRHIAGCGTSGRNIRLYFTPKAAGQSYDGSAGRFATSTFPWASGITEPHQQNVTLGEPLQVRGLIPALAAKVD
jgi:hypothetical protein